MASSVGKVAAVGTSYVDEDNADRHVGWMCSGRGDGGT